MNKDIDVWKKLFGRADPTNLPRRQGGIYVFAEKANVDPFGLPVPILVVYVGETINFRRRIKEHQTDPNGAADGKLMRWLKETSRPLLYYTKLEEEDEIKRIDLEKRMIKHYQPKFNDQHKDKNDRESQNVKEN